MRATSEPLPDTEEEQRPVGQPGIPPTIGLPVQEYSWEWGAFPQPSPMKASFGKGRRFEGGLFGGKDMNASWGGMESEAGSGRQRLAALSSDGEDEEAGVDLKTHRSQSVPPEVDGSPSRKRRDLPSFHDYGGNGRHGAGDEIQQDRYGAGGRFTGRKLEETRFTVSIEGRKVSFELSLVACDTHVSKEDPRRNKHDDTGSLFHSMSEVEAAHIFDQGKVTYLRFMENESVLKDERLVIRWAGNQ